MTATLGIDTSGAVGSVALLLPPGREVRFEQGLIHGVALAPAVAELLADAGLAPRDLSLVAVGVGPGSYTGVRVGVAFAKTLAFAAGIPATGVSSFDALARNAAPGRPVACVRNARRGAFYLRVYDPGGRPRGPHLLIPVDEARALLPPDAVVLGDAAISHPDFLSGDGREFGPREAAEVRALVVAELGAAAGPGDRDAIAPIYLRRSEAEERLMEKDDG